MEKSNFDKLLKRYVTDQVSHDEKVKLEAWLDVMKTENTDDLELSKEDGEELFKKITANRDNLKEIKAFRPTVKKTNGRWMMRFAASLMIGSLLSFSVWLALNYKDLNNTVSTIGAVDKMILDDGTIVWLRGDSKLSYDVKLGGARSTILQGEALFEVAKDPNHPFVIKCGNATLRVLGTSFKVVYTKDTLELNVLTGKVSISTPSNSDGIVVHPNEKIILIGDKPFVKTTIDSADISGMIGQTEYNMKLTDVTFNQAIERIEKKFNVSIDLKNSDIGKCRMTIDLTDHSLDGSLQLLSEIIDIDYLQTGSSITIGGKGCK